MRGLSAVINASLDRMLKELQRGQHKVERTVFAFLSS